MEAVVESSFNFPISQGSLCFSKISKQKLHDCATHHLPESHPADPLSLHKNMANCAYGNNLQQSLANKMIKSSKLNLNKSH
jgi:hypothetical protein